MTYLLRAHGHDVSTAADGEEAMQAMGAMVPDLVLMDLHMPNVDGFEAVRRMRAEPRLARVPVVAVTAYAMVGDRDRILASGFDGYLPKPLAPETFAHDVADFIGTPARHPEPAPLAAARSTLILVGPSAEARATLAVRLAAFGCLVRESSGAIEAADAASATGAHAVVVVPGDGTDFTLIALSGSSATLRALPFALRGESDEGSAAVPIGRAWFVGAGSDTATLRTEIEAALKARTT
jgi:two-component system cell cycle response regulator